MCELCLITLGVTGKIQGERSIYSINSEGEACLYSRGEVR